jgi:hypothetical protein
VIGESPIGQLVIRSSGKLVGMRGECDVLGKFLAISGQHPSLPVDQLAKR